MQIGANLGETGYLETIAAATNDICIQLIFNNAGYMLSGFFESKYAAGSDKITNLPAGELTEGQKQLLPL